MHEFIHILTSWPHWAFEVVTDIAVIIPGYVIGRLGVKRHDRRKHGLGSKDFEPQVLPWGTFPGEDPNQEGRLL
jgi:hypothetical protein